MYIQLVHVDKMKKWVEFFFFLPQCHEACIAIYSSMENQKISHWMFISVLSMFFCLLVYTLTGAVSIEPWSHVTSPGTNWTGSSLMFWCSRCLWLRDIWTRCGPGYFNVISWQRRGHDHRETALWNFHRHHLPHHSPAGEASHPVVNVVLKITW